MRKRLLAVILLVLPMLPALASSARAAGTCRALIVAGDPGPNAYTADRFHDWAFRWQKMLLDVYGYKADNIRVLWSPARTGGAVEEGKTMPAPKPELMKVPDKDLANSANLQSALAQLVAQSTAEDQVLVILIGHGYEQGKLSLFCLDDKDYCDTDAKRALEKLKAKELIFVNTAPASYEWVESLSRKDRVIIVADAQQGMGSMTYFNEFLLRALDGSKSNVLAAFNDAAMNTLAWYQNQFITPEGTTVHGKDNQEIFKQMYPDRAFTPGDDAPRKADNAASNTESWLGRRIIQEVAGLDDNGDGEVSTVYSEGKQPKPLPAPGGDGQLAGKITLGTP